MEGDCLLTKLEHLAEHRDASRCSRFFREHFKSLPRRGGIRVVTVIDHCDAVGQAHNLASVGRRPQLAGTKSNGIERYVKSHRYGSSGKHVSKISSTDERRRQIE